MANTKAAAAKRDGLKDLTPRTTTQVKGGKVMMQDLHVVKQTDKATPTL
jgi:type VI protein secretion system component Hcp